MIPRAEVTMRQRLAAMMMFLSSACATSPRPSAGGTWEQEVRAAEERHRQAFLATDTAALREMFSDRLVVNSPLNTVVDKTQLLAMVRSGRIAISSFDQQIERVERYGDVAVVMGQDAVVYAPPSPNAGQTQKRRFTDIWRREDGGWRFAARQATVIP
jgi:ketosteroid isomerase-like protein